MSRQNSVTWLTKWVNRMWKSVFGASLAGTEAAAVAEHAAVGGQAVALGVAQHVAAVELVEPEGALAAREPDRAALEQLLELLHDAEDADPLVLVDVVEVADRDDALGGDGLVVRLDALRDLGVAELLGGVRADADQLGEAVVRRRRPSWRRRSRAA